jgi:hypothetical protein
VAAVRGLLAQGRLDGSAHTLPTNFAAYLTADPVVGISYTAYQYGSAHSLGTKSDWSINGNRATCWDMATDSLCLPGFPIRLLRSGRAGEGAEDLPWAWRSHSSTVSHAPPTGVHPLVVCRDGMPCGVPA